MTKEKEEEKKLLDDINSRELKTLYVWKAPIRPFQQRGREFWKTVLTIAFFVGFILFLFKEWLLIATIASLLFVYYVLSTVEPEKIEHKITSRGIIYAGEMYYWEIISQFWFSEKYAQRLINFELRGEGFVHRLILMVGEGDEKTIKSILTKYILEQEIPPSFLDKASDWIQKKVPLEGESKSKVTSSATAHK